MRKGFYRFAAKTGQPAPLCGRHRAGKDRGMSVSLCKASDNRTKRAPSTIHITALPNPAQPTAAVRPGRRIGRPTGKGRQRREAIEGSERHSRRPAPCALIDPHALTAFLSAYRLSLPQVSCSGYSIQITASTNPSKIKRRLSKPHIFSV